MELRDTLKAMSPDILADIGVTLDADGEPVLEGASMNADVVVADTLDRPQPRRYDPY